MQGIKRIIILIFAACLALSFCACVGTDVDSNGVSVVATLFPQYDFARAIVGEKGSAVLLLPPGADSHNFELTPSDMQKINNCDVFVYTGPGMEIWVDNIIGSINSDVSVIDLSSAVGICLDAEEHSHDHDHAHTDTDPHIWTSPKNAMLMLTSVYNSICEADSDNTDYYKANYDKYYSELVALDAAFREIADTAKDKNLYFSGKFAFEHFVNEYGFSYVAPFNSCSDVQIESLAAIDNLITVIKKNNVRYIFYEELSQNAVLETIVSETDVQPLLLHSAHNVSKDEMESGASYISIMKNNAANLREALIDG